MLRAGCRGEQTGEPVPVGSGSLPVVQGQAEEPQESSREQAQCEPSTTGTRCSPAHFCSYLGRTCLLTLRRQNQKELAEQLWLGAAARLQAPPFEAHYQHLLKGLLLEPYVERSA